MRKLAAVPTLASRGHVHRLLDDLVFEDCHVLVLDNGMPDVDLERIVSRGTELTVLECRFQNLHQMWNRALDWAEADEASHLFLVNDDVRLRSADLIWQLSQRLDADDEIGVIGPRYNDHHKGKVGVIDVTGIAGRAGKGLAGFAFMLRGDVAYRFPEELKWWYGDNDLVKTMLTGGRRVCLDLDVEVEHVGGGGQTGEWDDPQTKAVLEQDRRLFQRRWKK